MVNYYKISSCLARFSLLNFYNLKNYSSYEHEISKIPYLNSATKHLVSEK